MERNRSRLPLVMLVVLLVGGALPVVGRAREATPAGTACPEPTGAALEEVPRRWYGEILTDGNLDALDALLDPAVVHHGATFGDVADAAGVKAILGAARTGFPDVRYAIDQIVTDAPYVAARWTASGTQTGEFQGIAPTGNRVTWHGINLWRIACGKVVESWSELDQIGRLQQLGVVPLGPATTAGEADGAPPAASPAACSPDDPAAIEALVARWWNEGWTQGNAAAFGEILGDDHVHHWATGPDTVGATAVAERIAQWRTAFPDLAISHGDILVDGEFAAGVWTITGTFDGPYVGANPTGAAVSAGGINIFRVACGRIAEIWSEMDVLGLREQAGLPDAAGDTPAATPNA